MGVVELFHSHYRQFGACVSIEPHAYLIDLLNGLRGQHAVGVRDIVVLPLYFG